MANRILVTGASGLIGRQMVPVLAEAGFEVHAVARSEVSRDMEPCVSAWHQHDLLGSQPLESLIRRVNPVDLMHLAWQVTPGSNDDSVHHHWLRSSKDLIRAFYENGGRRAVVAGTCYEYDWSEGICREDGTPRIPTTLYGSTKNALYEFTREFCEREGLNWAWGRVFLVYGPYEHPSRLVADVILNLLKGQPVECTHGRQARDYLHSRDVAEGLARLLGSDWQGACNIAAGRTVTLREIVETIAAKIGGRDLLRFGARSAPAGDPPVILADVARAREVLGWEARISLDEGLQKTIDVWRQELGMSPAVPTGA